MLGDGGARLLGEREGKGHGDRAGDVRHGCVGLRQRGRCWVLVEQRSVQPHLPSQYHYPWRPLLPTAICQNLPRKISSERAPVKRLQGTVGRPSWSRRPPARKNRCSPRGTTAARQHRWRRCVRRRVSPAQCECSLHPSLPLLATCAWGRAQGLKLAELRHAIRRGHQGAGPGPPPALALPPPPP